ncbi:70-kilodalton heat shock protein [Orobanche minor]
MRTPVKKEAPAIGIDFGTAYSCVGVWQNDRVEIIPNELGSRTTPSYVAFTDSGRLIGDSAKNQVNTNPRNTVFDVKRLIGRRFSDSSVQHDMKLWPFKVVAGAGDKPRIVVKYKGKEKQLSPEEIVSMIFVKMREIAEDYIGMKVKNAVCAVPACFNAAQRRAMTDAGLIAGLNIMRVFNEPSAAVIAYGLPKKAIDPTSIKDVLVFDLGGGTFDATVFTIEEGIFEVKASVGHRNLGGDDFVNRMVNYFVEEFEIKYNKKDINGDARALRRLWNSCEKAKRTLSTNTETVIEIDSFFDGIDLSVRISRAKFEQLNMYLFYECLELVDKCLKDSSVRKDDIREIILVGGSTRIPKVEQLLMEMFNGKELCKSINQDEAVAYGASVHAAIYSGEGHDSIADVLLLDLTPFSLGVEIHEGYMSVVIPRNTTIPTLKKKSFFVKELANEERKIIKVYEGEEMRARNNLCLGELDVSWMSNLGANDEICVCFDVDAYGSLNVSFEEKLSGKKNKISIKNDVRLSKEEIRRMVKDGEDFKADDDKCRKNAEAKNELETLAYNMKKNVEEKVSSSKFFGGAKRRFVLEAVEEVIQWLDSNQVAEVEECEEKMKELHSICDPFLS